MFIYCILIAIIIHQSSCDLYEPHSAFADTESDSGMRIVWYSVVDYSKRTDIIGRVWYGSTSDTATWELYSDAYYSCKYYEQNENVRALIRGLRSNTKYFYQVGFVDSTSGEIMGEKSLVRSFMTARSWKDEPRFNISIYGDLGSGTKAEDSEKYIKSTIDEADFVLHTGDFSYEDDGWETFVGFFTFTYNKIYTAWMNLMQPVLGTKAYMIAPGNHECECHSAYCLVRPSCKESLRNFTAYTCKWAMPSEESGGAANMWYSFDYGPVHFVAIDTETDYPGAPFENIGEIKLYGLGRFPTGHFREDGAQMAWLKKDLAKAAENRHNVPWIVVFGHRPFHTADAKKPEKNGCYYDGGACYFENVVNEYADIYFAGHIHYYSRLIPVNTSDYRFAQITPGGSGNIEWFWRDVKSQRQGTSAGFNFHLMGNVQSVGKLIMKGKHTLQWQAITSRDGKVFDEFTMTKDPTDPSLPPSFLNVSTIDV